MSVPVIVTNKGANDFEGRYDGEDYSISAKGGVCEMSAEAARHLVGYGVTDRKELVNIGLRHGWHIVNGKNDAGEPAILRRFKDFTITPCKLTADPSRAVAGGSEANAA